MELYDPVILLSTIFCGLVVVLFLYGRIVKYFHDHSPPVNRKRLEEWLTTEGIQLPTRDDIIREMNNMSDSTAVAIEGGVEWRHLRIERFLPDTSLPQFEIQSIKKMTDSKTVFTSVVRWPDCTPGLEVSVLLADNEKITCHLQVDWMLMFAECTLVKSSEGSVSLSWKQTSPPVTALSCMVIDPPHWKANIDISQPLLECPNAKASEGVSSSVADGVLKLLKNFEISTFDLSSTSTVVNGIGRQSDEINDQSNISEDEEIPVLDPRPDSHSTSGTPDSLTARPDSETIMTNSDNGRSDSQTSGPDSNATTGEPDSSTIRSDSSQPDSSTNKPDSNTSQPDSNTITDTHSMNSNDNVESTSDRVVQDDDVIINSIHDDKGHTLNTSNDHTSSSDDHAPNTDKSIKNKCNGDLPYEIKIEIISASPTPLLEQKEAEHVEEPPSSDPQSSPTPSEVTTPPDATPDMTRSTNTVVTFSDNKETTPIPEATAIIDSSKLDMVTPEKDATPTSNNVQETIGESNEHEDTTSNDNSTALSWKRSFHEDLNDSLNSSSSASQLRILTYSDEDLTSPGKSPFDRNKTLSIRSYDTDSPMTDASGQFLTTVVFEVQDGGRKKHIVAMNPTHANRLRKQLGKYTKLHIYNDHTFIATHIKGKQVCAVCDEKISGLFGKQAYVCRDCTVHTHKMCHHKMESACARSKVSTLNLIYPEKIPSYALS